MVRALLLAPLCAALAGCGGVVFGISAGINKDTRTPLEKAVMAGDLPEVQRLLASGADPNERGGLLGSPLYAATLRDNNAEVIRTLIAAGANPNGQPDTCWPTPVFSAASRGDLENTRALLDAGAAVRNPRCSTLAVGWLNPAIIDLLRQHGLDIFATDERGRNALHLALAPPVVPPAQAIEYLVKAGVPLNARDSAGKTPLAYWRQPRDFETHWFRVWLIERLSKDPASRRERENRVKISAFLERSGATL
jgi:ankyrin repeat protein